MIASTALLAKRGSTSERMKASRSDPGPLKSRGFPCRTMRFASCNAATILGSGTIGSAASRRGSIVCVAPASNPIGTSTPSPKAAAKRSSRDWSGRSNAPPPSDAARRSPNGASTQAIAGATRCSHSASFQSQSDRKSHHGRDEKTKSRPAPSRVRTASADMPGVQPKNWNAPRRRTPETRARNTAAGRFCKAIRTPAMPELPPFRNPVRPERRNRVGCRIETGRRSVTIFTEGAGIENVAHFGPMEQITPLPRGRSVCSHPVGDKVEQRDKLPVTALRRKMRQRRCGVVLPCKRPMRSVEVCRQEN